MAHELTKEFVQKLSEQTQHVDMLNNSKNDFTDRYYSELEPCNLSVDDFILYKKIGKGGFGSVYFSTDAVSRTKYYAMKILKKTKIIENKQTDNVKSERRILSSLRYRFTIMMHHHFQDETFLYLALEFVDGGELFYLLKQETYFNEDAAKFYAMQMVLAIEYLHYLDVIYRDIKPENVLIAGNGYLKLADFGFAKLMQQNRTYTLCGTPEYVAPEIILNKGYGTAVDWWAIGIFIYELLAGHTPFYDSETRQIYVNIVTCDYKFPGHFTDAAKSLTRKLLVTDLTRRFGNLRRKVDDIKNHRWFMVKGGYTWTGIYDQSERVPSEVEACKVKTVSDLCMKSLAVLKCQPFESEESKELFADF